MNGHLALRGLHLYSLVREVDTGGTPFLFTADVMGTRCTTVPRKPVRAISTAAAVTVPPVGVKVPVQSCVLETAPNWAVTTYSLGSSMSSDDTRVA